MIVSRGVGRGPVGIVSAYGLGRSVTVFISGVTERKLAPGEQPPKGFQDDRDILEITPILARIFQANDYPHG